MSEIHATIHHGVDEVGRYTGHFRLVLTAADDIHVSEWARYREFLRVVRGDTVYAATVQYAEAAPMVTVTHSLPVKTVSRAHHP